MASNRSACDTTALGHAAANLKVECNTIVLRPHASLKSDDESRVITVQCSNTTDCTEPLQAALLEGDHVIVPNINRPWITRPLILNRSHLTLELQEGVILQARRHWYHLGPAPNSAGGIMLLKVDGTQNVRIIGRGSGERTATLRMWRSDYANASLYTHSEDRVSLQNDLSSPAAFM